MLFARVRLPKSRASLLSIWPFGRGSYLRVRANGICSTTYGERKMVLRVRVRLRRLANDQHCPSDRVMPSTEILTAMHLGEGHE